ncbi:MAG: hypothetical protein O9266_11550 [Porphyrobacter sp.]|nr:hypothetical protein [Porphyrobacter sp.]
MTRTVVDFAADMIGTFRDANLALPSNRMREWGQMIPVSYTAMMAHLAPMTCPPLLSCPFAAIEALRAARFSVSGLCLKCLQQTGFNVHG